MKAYSSSKFPPEPKAIYDGLVVRLKQNCFNDAFFRDDAAFDCLYPEHFQLLSQHWTPLAVARRAAAFLAEPEAKILDIGSGIGKFCLAAGHYFPETFFYGVEQRQELIYLAEEIKGHMKMENANFIYANITQLNFTEFDHFYFYNSFYENLDPDNRIDDTLELSGGLYDYYTKYLYTALNERPSGTRLVTSHTFDEEVPPAYQLANMSKDGLLKMWIKK
jgi:hypothetical protein